MFINVCDLLLLLSLFIPSSYNQIFLSILDVYIYYTVFMVRKNLHLIGAVVSILIYSSAFSQCNECTPDQSCQAIDGFPTLCPEVLPNGTAGEFYESIATFNLPGNVVDPGSGLDATLQSVYIANISGLPFGLELAPNNADGYYYPNNGDNYGCATICGTPLSAGEYFVTISVDVIASAFGFEQSLTQSFSLPLTIDPGESVANASFSVSANTGCAPLNIDVENFISGAGVTYSWDFGGPSNGSTMSLEILTDGYPAETTWLINNSDGNLLASGGPYSEAETVYVEQICLGQGSYTLTFNDSYGDGMQFEGVAGNYILTDGGGNVLAQIVDGGDFGAEAINAFTIDSSNLVGGCVINSSNPNVVYDAPGAYTMSLTTTVTELNLTALNIVELSDGWGDDVEDFFGLGSPDPFFVLNGDVAFTSSTVNDQATPDFTNLSVTLTYGGYYEISFYDEDGPFTSNDNLGSASFYATGPGAYTIYGGGNVAIITLEESLSAEFYDTENISVFSELEVWADADGDGFGNGDLPINGCELDSSTQFAYNGEDCNDNEAIIYPGAPGTFDGLDNNCDQIVDGDEIIALEGCLDPLASNYNPLANVSDESCIYIDCPGDFNFDGAITVNDLLLLLSDFGCSDDCYTDLNGDDYVSVADLLSILSIFGTLCD